MRWEDERYVRVYTRDTVDWLALSFEAQGLMTLILRKMDRAGVMRLGRHGKRGVAAAIGHAHRWETIAPALEELLADGCLALRGDCLVAPNFIQAQEAVQSDSARKRAQRERDRDKTMAQGAVDAAHPYPPFAAPVQEARDEKPTLGHALASRPAVTPDVTPVVTEDSHAGKVTPSLAVPSVPSVPAEKPSRTHAPAREASPSPPPQPRGLREALEKDFHQVMGKAMRWEPAHERLLERILAAGEEEIRARWRRALRTQFPKCWSLKQLVEHWDAYAADAPGRPKDVRRGHLRAEDMRHDEPIGEVKL